MDILWRSCIRRVIICIVMRIDPEPEARAARPARRSRERRGHPLLRSAAAARCHSRGPRSGRRPHLRGTTRGRPKTRSRRSTTRRTSPICARPPPSCAAPAAARRASSWPTVFPYGPNPRATRRPVASRAILLRHLHAHPRRHVRRGAGRRIGGAARRRTRRRRREARSTSSRGRPATTPSATAAAATATSTTPPSPPNRSREGGPGRGPRSRRPPRQRHAAHLL